VRPARRRSRLVTLSSDVGAAYAAQMKAVLARSLPPGHVIDLSHDLPAHGIREAAFVVRAMAGGYPAGTVHVVVVDPGVGTDRAPLVIACRDGSRLVGPDNGVLAPLSDALGGGRAYRIDPGRIPGAPARIGTTFDGRDLFAPTAARLALGARASSLGRPIAAQELDLPEPSRKRRSATGEIVHVDSFGNLITSIPTSWIPRRTARVSVRLRRSPSRTLPFVTSYASLPLGRLGVLGSSFGTLEIAVREGRAIGRLRAPAGSTVAFGWGL
jgi:S-adenosyl-L-methionine hydrolase (adenosine-forming)